MTDLYIFSYGALFYPDKTPTPRLRAGVDKWIAARQNGHIGGQAAVLWPCSDVGRRYAFKEAGVADRYLARLPHEAQALENGRGLKDKLGLDAVYMSFHFVNYVDPRLPVGPGPTPEPRANDPQWGPGWRLPEPGMIAAALRAAGIAPGGALMVYDTEAEKGAADRLFVPNVYSSHFFLSWPNHDRHVKARSAVRLPLEYWAEKVES